jgi:hypothetical protein
MGCDWLGCVGTSVFGGEPSAVRFGLTLAHKIASAADY